MADNFDSMEGSSKDNVGEAAQEVEPTFAAKRSLVPLNEYAAAHGISADLVEQQGRLGVVQIRKFKGSKFVVDVPDADLIFDEDEKPAAAAGDSRPQKGRPFLSAVATFAIVSLAAVLAAVIWLYLDSQAAVERLNGELAAVQAEYDRLSQSDPKASTVQNELVLSRAELQRVQEQVVASRADLERIQSDLSRARRSLETIQSDLTGVQGQLARSRVEIEGIQNGLNVNKQSLDAISAQNAPSADK